MAICTLETEVEEDHNEDDEGVVGSSNSFTMHYRHHPHRRGRIRKRDVIYATMGLRTRRTLKQLAFMKFFEERGISFGANRTGTDGSSTSPQPMFWTKTNRATTTSTPAQRRPQPYDETLTQPFAIPEPYYAPGVEQVSERFRCACGRRGGDTPQLDYAPQSDLTLPGCKLVVVATASLPWMTCTAANPLLRIAHLCRSNDATE